MAVVARIAGFVLLIFGLVWIGVVAGGVLSRSEQGLDPLGLLIGFIVHTVCMGLGTGLVAWGAKAKRVRHAA